MSTGRITAVGPVVRQLNPVAVLAKPRSGGALSFWGWVTETAR